MQRLALLLLVGAATLFPLHALAQDGAVEGRVTDAENGEAMPGANVILQELDRGAASDAQGYFRIPDVPPGTYTIRSTFIGYRPVSQSVTVSAGETVTVNLAFQSDFLGLDEVVVTALGVERARQGLTYSVQQLQGSEISESPSPNVLNALQGKVAGMNITPSSGLPGSSAQITIRGSNSLTGNNQPLFVIDGIPVQGGPVIDVLDADFGNGVSGADAPSRLADINPNDIESVTVLKGSAAVGLYGVRASNGVVLITTRTGGIGTQNRVNVNFSSTVTLDEVSVLPDLQTSYAQGTGGAYNVAASTSWGPRLSDLPARIVNAVGDTVDAPRTPFENVTPFFQTGVTNTNAIDVSGSNQYGNYIASASYTTQDGIIRNTGMERITTRLAGEYALSTWLRTGGSVSYTRSDIAQIPGGSFLSNPLFTLYWAPVSYDLWGLPFARPENPYAQVNYRGAIDNPRWAIENNEFGDVADRVFGNLHAELTPLDGVTVSYRIGTDVLSNRRKQVLDLGSGGTGGRTAVPSGGQITEISVDQTETTSLLTATYNTRVGRDVGVSLLVGNDVNRYDRTLSRMVGNGLAMGGFRNISNAASIIGAETTSRALNIGLFGDLQLDWRQTFFLGLTGRNDWSSTMPADSRSFFYPSISGAFAFTELMDGGIRDIINYGKIRASYAQVGQVAPMFTTVQVFTPGSATSGFLTDGFEFPYSGIAAFTQGTEIRRGVRPQNNTTVEVGAELALLGERIGIDYAWFRERAIDQIFSVPVSTASGYFTELRNAGELVNNGHELQLRVEPIRTSAFTWDVAFNFSAVRSEVVELAEGVDNIFLGGFVTPNVRAQAGQPYPIIFGSRFLRDAEGNIVHDSREDSPTYGYPLQDPVLGSIGRVAPDWTGGLTNSFRYRNLRVNAQVDIRQGGMMWAGNTRLQKLYGMDVMTEDRESEVVLDGVKGYLNDNGELVVEGRNDIPIVRDQNFWQFHMDTIEESNSYDTSFIRLRELRVAYSLPTTFLQRNLPQVRGLELSLTGRNLILWTDYPNFDPETNLGGATNFQGFEYVNLPGTRSYGFAARFSF